ncbi:MAG: DUF6431 domain-containing protein [Lachnospiraceae bacterium]|nr:DUF6431 domain-containing protein [Lachnospiraceae bacterium]
MVESNDVVPRCPTCGGKLEYRDSRKRIHRSAGGTVKYLIIRRFKCTDCGAYHNELPDCCVPYKHYDSRIICDVIDGKVTSDDIEFEDYPCEETMKRWIAWFKENRSRAEGYIRNTMYKLLDNDDDFLLSGASLLSLIKEKEVMPHWLGYILRFIYNSGGRLVPLWY